MTGHNPTLIFEESKKGKEAVSLPESDVPGYPLPVEFLRDEEVLNLPEVSELDIVRHYMKLSQLNFSIDTEFYPLGSCTMKYNPKINEIAATQSGFLYNHPLTPDTLSQGSKELLFRLQEVLKSITGFKEISLQPAAGAQGELSGVLMIKAYHQKKGDRKRTKILIPDSAHGTNPASVTMSGFDAVEIPSDERGNIDLKALKEQCGDDVAGLMITNPNTLGLFEENIVEVIKVIHECGGLVYGDGANLNAVLGVLRPGDLDIDVMHFNLHKTFSTPHGGGGPGAGPVGAGERLISFLPGKIVRESDEGYYFYQTENSIGNVKSFFGNFGILVRAYVYILMNGSKGLRDIAHNAVLNANYLKKLLQDDFYIKFNRRCMHEFVVAPSDENLHTMDIAKRLIDYGFHPPTVYFPLIVKEALMIEPTETEGKETLERFAEALKTIIHESKDTPEKLHQAPQITPVGRLDEVAAVRNLAITYKDLE